MQNVVVQIDARLSWKVQRTPRGYVANCEPLGVAAQGDTLPELNHMIAEILQELFTDLLQDGELERFLSDRGWRVVGAMPRREMLPDVAFDVPYSLTEPARASA